MMTGVSVLLPTFNRAGLIGETIESLLAQTRRPDEIIVINDGSTDATREVLERYASDLRVIDQTNSGKSTALNRALAEASQPCIWICDDDDIILPDTCATLMAELESDPGLGFCAGRHTDFEVDPATGARILMAPGYTRASAPDEIFPDLMDGCHIFQPGLIVRRAVYDSVGPFRTDLTRSQDYEMILRIARHHRGKLRPETVFLHREHKGDRGPAGERFGADQNAARWKVYNRLIFDEILSSIDESQLLPARLLVTLSDKQRSRMLRLKRACVLVRQRMWIDGIAEWDAIARENAGPLSAAECEIFDRSTSSSLGTPELFEDADVQRALARLATRGPLGRFMLRRLVRRVRWNLRKALQDRNRPQAVIVARFLLLATRWSLWPVAPKEPA
jgi:glycosyltransferase involved in cell wall biosynthesis